MNEASPQSPFNTLFRGVSPCVKIVGLYGAAFSLEYIPKILAGPVKIVCANTGSLQILPSKAKTDDPAQLLRNRERLIQLTQIFIDSIVASVQDAPIEFRRLFKILHEELKVSMGEYQATNLATSILFLRFFCPAIVKPVEHRIIDQIVPEKVPDLIMVTKVLQTLANFTKFGKKEENMKELNPFIDSNLDKLRKFFEEFVDLGDESRELELNINEVSILDNELIQQIGLDSSLIETPTLELMSEITQIPMNGHLPISRRSSYALTSSGFLRPPEFPVFKGDHPMTKSHPSSVVIRQSISLIIALSPSFKKICAHNPDIDSMSEGERRALRDLQSSSDVFEKAQNIFLEEQFVSEGKSRLRKPSTLMETQSMDFLRLLLSNDMVFLSSILGVLTVSNMDAVVNALAYIFNSYNLVSRLLRFVISYELVSSLRKWEAKPM